MPEYIEREAVDNKIREAQKELETNDDRMWRINKPYFKGFAWARRILLDEPAADVVEVVRCKECKNCYINGFGKKSNTGVCNRRGDICMVVQLDDYCSYGERKGDCNNCKNHSNERKGGDE